MPRSRIGVTLSKLGIDRVFAQVLPDAKAAKVEALLSPAPGAIFMSLSTVVVAVNAQLLGRPRP